MGEQESTWTTAVRQHPERAVPQRAQEFLAQGQVAHIGFEHDGRPYVIPTLYHYSGEHPDRIYLHGGMSSRMLAELAQGIPVCVTVTQLDGLVYSRDAKYHSANYRCVMCFGRGRIFEDEEKKRVMFEAMTQRYFPGRIAGRDYTPAPSSHLTHNRGCGSDHRGDQRQDARRRPQRSSGRAGRRPRHVWDPGRVATPTPSPGNSTPRHAQFATQWHRRNQSFPAPSSTLRCQSRKQC